MNIFILTSSKYCISCACACKFKSLMTAILSFCINQFYNHQVHFMSSINSDKISVKFCFTISDRKLFFGILYSLIYHEWIFFEERYFLVLKKFRFLCFSWIHKLQNLWGHHRLLRRSYFRIVGIFKIKSRQIVVQLIAYLQMSKKTNALWLVLIICVWLVNQKGPE